MMIFVLIISAILFSSFLSNNADVVRYILDSAAYGFAADIFPLLFLRTSKRQISKVNG